MLETEPDENKSYGREVRLLGTLVGGKEPEAKATFALELAPAEASKGGAKKKG